MDVIARLDDGTLYNNWHCFVHEIRDGKIVQTREYLDTHHMWVALVRWASWGRTPVPPRSVPRRSNLQEIATVIQYPTMFLELDRWKPFGPRSEEHTSELQSLMSISYAVFCLKKKKEYYTLVYHTLNVYNIYNSIQH